MVRRKFLNFLRHYFSQNNFVLPGLKKRIYFLWSNHPHPEKAFQFRYDNYDLLTRARCESVCSSKTKAS